MSKDHDGSLSTTDVDGSLADEMKQWHLSDLDSDQQMRQNACRQTRIPWRWLVDTFLLLVIIGLLLLHRSGRNPSFSSSYEVGGHYQGDGPHCESLYVAD